MFIYTISISSLIFAIFEFIIYSHTTNKIEDLIIVTFGGIGDISNGLDIIGMMLYCSPQLAFIMLMSNYMLSDFNISAVVVFTREASKTKWIYKRYFEMFLYSSLYAGIQFGVVLACGFIRGNSITDAKFLVSIICIEFLLITMSIFTFTIICNTAILKLSKNIVMLGVVFVYLISLSITLAFSNLFNGILMKVMPIANSMLRWHSLSYFPNKFSYLETIIIGKLSFSWSLCYWLFLTAITVLIGKLLINNMDILDIEKGELN